MKIYIRTAVFLLDKPMVVLAAIKDIFYIYGIRI